MVAVVVVTVVMSIMAIGGLVTNTFLFLLLVKSKWYFQKKTHDVQLRWGKT